LLPLGEQRAIDWAEMGTSWGQRVAVSVNGTESLASVRIKLSLELRASVKTDSGSTMGDLVGQTEVYMLIGRVGTTEETTVYVYNDTPYWAEMKILGAEAKPFGHEYEPAAVEYNLGGNLLWFAPNERFK
jgi:hypothetical protein